MSTTDEQVVRERLDLEMMERPHLWPDRSAFSHAPLLHVKRGTGREQQYGHLVHLPQNVKPYMVATFEIDNPTEHDAVLAYENADAIRADGWVVD